MSRKRTQNIMGMRKWKREDVGGGRWLFFGHCPRKARKKE